MRPLRTSRAGRSTSSRSPAKSTYCTARDKCGTDPTPGYGSLVLRTRNPGCRDRLLLGEALPQQTGVHQRLDRQPLGLYIFESRDQQRRIMLSDRSRLDRRRGGSSNRPWSWRFRDRVELDGARRILRHPRDRHNMHRMTSLAWAVPMMAALGDDMVTIMRSSQRINQSVCERLHSGPRRRSRLGFSRRSGCFTYSAPTPTSVGLKPRERASLNWTHTGRYQEGTSVCGMTEVGRTETFALGGSGQGSLTDSELTATTGRESWPARLVNRVLCGFSSAEVSSPSCGYQSAPSHSIGIRGNQPEQRRHHDCGIEQCRSRFVRHAVRNHTGESGASRQKRVRGHP